MPVGGCQRNRQKGKGGGLEGSSRMQMLRIQKWELLQRERSDCKQDERSKSHIVQQETPTQMTSTVVITGTKRMSVLTKLLKCQSHSKVVTFVILGDLVTLV